MAVRQPLRCGHFAARGMEARRVQSVKEGCVGRWFRVIIM